MVTVGGVKKKKKEVDPSIKKGYGAEPVVNRDVSDKPVTDQFGKTAADYKKSPTPYHISSPTGQPQRDFATREEYEKAKREMGTSQDPYKEIRERKQELKTAEGYAKTNIDVKDAESKILEERKQEEEIKKVELKTKQANERQTRTGNFLKEFGKAAVSMAEEVTLAPGVKGRVPLAIKAEAGLFAVSAGTSSLMLRTLGIAGLSATATTSGIITWLASDNLLSSMNIFTRDLRQAVQFGETDPASALEKLDESQNYINEAKTFINYNTMVNPLLWPFRKIIMTNAEASQFVIDTNREMIEGNK